MSATSIFQPPPSCRTTTSSQHARPLGVHVASPMAWNALPDDLRDPLLSADNFRKKLKTHVSECTWTLSALEALRNALYKFKTHLLTYLLCARKNEACIILYVYIYYFMSVEMFCSYMFYALEKTAVVIIALIYDV